MEPLYSPRLADISFAVRVAGHPQNNREECGQAGQREPLENLEMRTGFPKLGEKFLRQRRH